MDLLKNSGDAQKIVTVVVLIAGGYILYKTIKAANEGVSNIKDVFGSGNEAARADKILTSLKSDKLSPFNPSFLPTYMKEHAGKKVLLVTPASKKAIVDKVIKNLSYSQTFLTPFKFKENRQAVVNTFIDGMKSKTQLADVAAEYRKRTGKNLLDALQVGFRETSATTGAEIERMFSDLLYFFTTLK